MFSTNFTRFKFDFEALAEFAITDISAETIPKDFERNAKIHHCYVVQYK